MHRFQRCVAVSATTTLALLGGLAGPAARASTAPATADVTAAPQVRVDQAGYLPGETKVARLMVAEPLRHGRFRVVDRRGHVMRRGTLSARPSSGWNDTYRAVYVLRFTGLHAPGHYRITVTAPGVHAVSPPFRVLRAGSLYGPLLRDGVRFDQVQRDGADVVAGALHRRPSHLLDRHASVYAWPHMQPGSDLITDPDLTRIGGPVDVAGGWFDAGDYLKFTHSAAYNDVLLFTSARMLGRRTPPALLAEARHGLSWLGRMWDAKTRTMYFQVGIGSGNEQGTFRGDHDGWRLPQDDDANTAPVDRYVSHRPVFEAAPPGHRISPNLAGRVSASFALAAQVDARRDPGRARRELATATQVYGFADTANPPHPLVTALPHAFYPEASWRDDMELGASEIALARRDLHRPSTRYVRDAAHWAHGYLEHGVQDTLNLYDTSALAHHDLVLAMSSASGRGHGTRPGHARAHLQVTRAELLGNLRAQLMHGVRHAEQDPFAAGVAYDDFDVNSHTFGLIATAGLYDGLTRTHAFARFVTAQRSWLLGGDPWGVGSMVGVGTDFPHCMQHQVANLEGSTDGSAPLDVGAVVNGPNNADNFEGGLGGFQDGMVPCSVPGLVAFDARDSRYVDDVRSWQTDEPALDMTGAAIIASAAELGLHPRARVGR